MAFVIAYPVTDPKGHACVQLPKHFVSQAMVVLRFFCTCLLSTIVTRSKAQQGFMLATPQKAALLPVGLFERTSSSLMVVQETVKEMGVLQGMATVFSGLLDAEKKHEDMQEQELGKLEELTRSAAQAAESMQKDRQKILDQQKMLSQQQKETQKNIDENRRQEADLQKKRDAGPMRIARCSVVVVV